jgi:hypothetical protein
MLAGWRANWSQVFGDAPMLVTLLPSRRKPPPPVVPFLGVPEGAELEPWGSSSSSSFAAQHIV